MGQKAEHIRPEGGQLHALPPIPKMAPAEEAGHPHPAMVASRLELNLVRLLCRCEAMAAEKRDPEDWRLEKVRVLKGMLQAEKLASSSEKALANQFLTPGRVPTTARERVPATKTVHLQSRARYTSEMRSELLGADSAGEPQPDVRKRPGATRPKPADEKQSAAELDLVLQRHQDLQEKLAEEMLGLARSLKTNTLAAQSVIKKDNQTLSHSLKMADQNLEKLKTESERLEQHAQKSVNWLLWAMLIVVCFIFISMILFIRIVPKLK
ncbi:PREDICTED: vesicle transport protein USE1 isoform X1 [Dipodomys ordii]|uniref:Vesicle transport protein USE1 n=1 Tax=Dipodomys ordii TaxID=10020 RepID=A0A1S3G4T0_DIPOR|nr:PREDICTED: vesicle transport protein USE1 isoform X1 [Dipodomys ordii]